MRRFWLIFALPIAVAPLAAAADAPVRTVVYRYSVDEHGFYGAPTMQGYGVVTENGAAGAGGSSGTIRVDVMSATSDDGLVVDVTQSVDRELKPLQTMRCALYGRTQDVVCDQNLLPTEAESVLLMYFGRYFYEPSRLDIAAHWHTTPNFHDKQATIDNDYTVQKTDGDVVTVKVARMEKGGGYLAKTDGTVSYNAALSVPEFIKLATTLQRSGEQGDMNVELHLISDSMVKSSSQTSH